MSSEGRALFRPMRRTAAHPCPLPPRAKRGAVRRRGCAAAACSALIVIIGLMIGSVAAATEPTPRVASLNLCTDQLLLALADPDQIVGLGPYSRDAARSWAAADASRFRILSGSAEDVLTLRPDLIVGGTFERRATRELLRAYRLPVETFDVARSIDDARAAITRMGALVGHPDRAAAVLARIDDALARTRAAASTTPRRVLAVARRGWVPGGHTLITVLLEAAGLVNAAPTLGVGTGGFAALEAIVAARPDLILVTGEDDTPEDQGQAFLLHPALTRLYPPEKRLVVPERLTICGGPMLAETLDRLTEALGRLPPP